MRHLLLLALSAHAFAADPPAAKPTLTFGLITDVQYADANTEGERNYRATPAKLAQAVEALNASHVAFTLNLGDTIDRDFKSFATVKDITSRLAAPLHSLTGNHDYNIADADKPRVAATLGMPDNHYSFRHSGVRFLMLDTNSTSIYQHAADAPETAAAKATLATLKAAGAPNATPWNGGVDDAQLAWLERELTASDAAKEAVIVCGHHQLLPADAHCVWNAPAVIDILVRHHCVKAWFNGHNHDGAFAEKDGLPFVTFRSLLHKPDITSHAVISMFPDHMEITGSGRETSRTLPLRP